MVCNRSWHLPGIPNLVCHPDRLIKEGGCVDLPMHTIHLKDPLVLLGFEDSVPNSPPVLSSPSITVNSEKIALV